MIPEITDAATRISELFQEEINEAEYNQETCEYVDWLSSLRDRACPTGLACQSLPKGTSDTMFDLPQTRSVLRLEALDRGTVRRPLHHGTSI